MFFFPADFQYGIKLERECSAYTCIIPSGSRANRYISFQFYDGLKTCSFTGEIDVYGMYIDVYIEFTLAFENQHSVFVTDIPTINVKSCRSERKRNGKWGVVVMLNAIAK